VNITVTAPPTNASAVTSPFTNQNTTNNNNPSRTPARRPTLKFGSSPLLPTDKIEWSKGQLIGKGSFGKVYCGLNKRTGEMIAVKQVQLNSDEDKEQAQSLQTEVCFDLFYFIFFSIILILIIILCVS
jgi:hypothetical protein